MVSSCFSFHRRRMCRAQCGLSVTHSPSRSLFFTGEVSALRTKCSHSNGLLFPEAKPASAVGERWCAGRAPGTFFFYHSPPVPVFAPTSPNNLEYLLAVSKNLAHPLDLVSDDGKGGGWKWWE